MNNGVTMLLKKKEQKSLSSSDLNQFLADTVAKAHELYLDRQKNNTPGDDVSDWLKAEEIIKKEKNIK